MPKNRSIAGTFLIVVGLAFPSGPARAGEGFGWNKKTVGLTRVHPPKVLLAGSRLSVKGGSSNPDLQGLAQQLQVQLESALINADPRLTSDAEHPEILIDVSVLHDDFSEEWQTRNETRSARVGTDSKGRPVYGPVPVQVRYKVIQSDFAVAYKVSDVTKKLNLDANAISLPFKKDFEDGVNAPEKFALDSSNVQAAVLRMVQRLAPTREPVSVLLPKGSLEDFAKLAEGRLWNKYLEALEGVPAKAKPEDESYRQYALGTAYEALGYAADDPETTLRYLTQAASYYNQALETNPGEKYFSKPFDSVLTTKSAAAPVERVKEALADYQRLKQMKEQYERIQVAKSLAPAGKALAGTTGTGGRSEAADGEPIAGQGRSDAAADGRASDEAPGPDAKELFYNPEGGTISTGASAASEPSSTGGCSPGGQTVPERRPVRRRSDPVGRRALGLSYWVELVDREGGAGRQVTAQRVFHSGEGIRLHFRSNSDGQIALLQLGSSGGAGLLFPDSELGLSDAALNADQDRVLPGEGTSFEFDDRTGMERLVVLFARSKDEMESLPLRRRMDSEMTRVVLESAETLRGSRDLFIATETKTASEVGTYGVTLSGKPVILEIRLKHER